MFGFNPNANQAEAVDNEFFFNISASLIWVRECKSAINKKALVFSWDFLIAGKDSGSKLQKAKLMNIEIKGTQFVDDLINN